MNDIHASDDGVTKLLQKINTRKATGPDKIPARMLKECSKDIAPILAIVFNKSILTGQVPDDWKKANVSAIFKKGQCYDPASNSCGSYITMVSEALHTTGYHPSILIGHRRWWSKGVHLTVFQ